MADVNNSLRISLPSGRCASMVDGEDAEASIQVPAGEAALSLSIVTSMILVIDVYACSRYAANIPVGLLTDLSRPLGKSSAAVLVVVPRIVALVPAGLTIAHCLNCIRPECKDEADGSLREQAHSPPWSFRSRPKQITRTLLVCEIPVVDLA